MVDAVRCNKIYRTLYYCLDSNVSGLTCLPESQSVLKRFKSRIIEIKFLYYSLLPEIVHDGSDGRTVTCVLGM